MRSTARAWTFFAYAAMCLLSACSVVMGDDKPFELKPSKQLTVVEGPVLPDGRIDFISAMNQHTSQGVTHENNAFRALFLLFPLDDQQDLGPDETSSTTVMSELLEITERERTQITPIVGLYEYAEQNGLTYEEIGEIEVAIIEFDFKHPKIEIFEQWIGSQEPGLQQLIAAINRPKYWRPEFEDITSPGSGQFALAPFAGKQRRLARMLDWRARYALYKEDRETFIELVVSIYRLSDHLAQNPFLIDRLVANSIEYFANDLMCHALRNQLLGANDLTVLQKSFEGRTPRPAMSEVMAFGERIYSISFFLAYATGKDSIGRLYDDFIFEPVDTTALDKAISKYGVDLEAGLKLIATKSKLDTSALKSETFADFSKLNQIQKNLSNPRKEAIKAKHVVEDEDGAKTIKIPRESRNSFALAELILELPVILMGEFFGDFSDSFGQSHFSFEARRRVCQAALALERYRQANGAYPDRLEELLPRYCKQMPIDPMDGNPLRYRKEKDGTAVIYSIHTNLKDDGGMTDPDDFEAVQDGDYVWRLGLPKP